MHPTQLPEVFTYSRTKDAVDDWVSGGVEGRQALDEGRKLLPLGCVRN